MPRKRLRYTYTNGPICKLHYWMALAEVENPQEAPLVLFLNGGPGSSSVLGFMQEVGPFLVDADGGLMQNPWSWTKVANLMVLEAPIGVGYSYCSKQFDGVPCVNTDKFTASASRAALVDFFENKFPELAGNHFFITGESYAGIYIPTLAKQLLDNAPQVNLVGIAVGDPCTDNTAQKDSMDALWYGHKYGLIDDAVFDKLWNECGYRVPTVYARGGPHLVAAKLNAQLVQEQDRAIYAGASRDAHNVNAATPD
jgi:serine carboxypeptidase-like clade 1